MNCQLVWFTFALPPKNAIGMLVYTDMVHEPALRVA
jgi:hypothetical protein